MISMFSKYKMGKKGAFRDLSEMGLGIGVFVIILVIVAAILNGFSVSGVFTAGGYAANITTTGLQAVKTLSDFTQIIVIAGVGVVLIALVWKAFGTGGEPRM